MTSEKRWFALYTKPYKEYLVRDLLRSRGAQVYLPEITVIDRSRRRKRKPFFRNYLFACLDPRGSLMGKVRWTPGLRRIVSAGSRPVVVPEQVVDHIRRRLARMGAVEAEGPFEKGDPVHIVSGPFEGLDAVFEERLSPRGRVRVFLEWMGRLTAAELDLGDLAPPR
jgi:transcriptional antiterminator RfaH